MIHLDKLSADEAERLAYAEGYTGTAELFARIDQLEVERDLLLRKVEHLTAQVDLLAVELSYAKLDWPQVGDAE